MNTDQRSVYLSATNLQAGYRNKRSETCVARASDLAIHSGDFICLLGPNGAGKSTLIRTLAGIQTPLHGTLQLQGQTYEQLSPVERARKVSVVLTEPMPVGMMDGYSLVALGRHPHSDKLGALDQQDRERIEWALQVTDAQGLRDRLISSLSDGERQKLLIARALAQETSLTLMDEPTAFLDLAGRIELMVALRKLTQQNDCALLVSTHDLELALRFADCIWLLDKEGTITQGYPEELVINGTISRTFSSKEIEWSREQGTFRTQLHRNLSATIQGDDMLVLWTKRALERLGFKIVDPGENAILQVNASGDAENGTWVVRYEGSESHHSSITAFIDFASSSDFLTEENV